MCTVSMIMDHYNDKWRQRLPNTYPEPYSWPSQMPPTQTVPDGLGALAEFLKPKTPAITPEEIAEFRALLERAREYDRRNNEPDCELDTKRQALKDIASQLGVEISFV